MNSKPKAFDTVSTATLRDSDLLRAMLDTLKQYRPKKYADLIAEGEAVLEKFGDFGYIGYLQAGENLEVDMATPDEMDNIEWLINEDLYDAMNDIAPAGTSYGSHPGDGALFGYWPDEDSDMWE
jgi:hypothetical protein